MLGGHYKNFDAIAMTYYLRFPNESTWTAAATAAGFYSEPVRARNADGTFAADDLSTPADEAWEPPTLLAYTHDRAIDVVGTITRGGEWNLTTGKQIVAPTVLDGYHVNFIGALPTGWDEFLVTPAAPYRVFA
jgi:hypothetical protein